MPTTSVDLDERLLRGVALKETGVDGKAAYRYFPHGDLPPDPESRFKLLFGERAKWAKDELDPYLEPLVAPGVTIPGLLIKFTRSIVAVGAASDQTTMFCAR